jgi:uncharacterized protein YkwD
VTKARPRAFLVSIALAALLLQLSSIAQNRAPELRHSATAPSGPEKDLFDSTNRERAAEDLPPLQWDPALAAAARKHVLRMAGEKLLEHQYSGEDSLRERAGSAGARFSVVAENIAVARDPEAIHMGWMHSPGHRGNILDPQLTSVGIAVVERRGYMFATQDFARAVEDLTLDEQEKRVAAMLTANGFKPVVIANEDARKTCAVNDGYSGKPAKYLRFETSDLSKLPVNVLSRLRTMQARSAAIGACTAKSASGFTRYRLAILFF